VKEFYENTMSDVRGGRIPFDDAIINSFLGIEYYFGDRPYQYALLANGIIDYEKIEWIVCVLGGTFI